MHRARVVALVVLCVLGGVPSAAAGSSGDGSGANTRGVTSRSLAPSFGPLAPPAAGRSVVGRYRPPLPGLQMVRPFVPPPSPYAAGHRGVDLAVHADDLVLAAGAGRISFAGTVVDRGVVVIQHPDGIRTEYEPIVPLVAAGDAVVAGQPVGRVRGQHGTCHPDTCLHWGARRGAIYFDPLTLLRPLAPVRLLPWR